MAHKNLKELVLTALTELCQEHDNEDLFFNLTTISRKIPGTYSPSEPLVKRTLKAYVAEDKIREIKIVNSCESISPPYLRATTGYRTKNNSDNEEEPRKS